MLISDMLNGFRKSKRKKIMIERKKQLNNNNFTIFSSNCMAGILYHDFNLQFNSPTINMYMTPGDFLKFCKNPMNYTGEDMKLIENTPYIKVINSDIILHCLHYSSFEEVKEKWASRFKRINWDNIYVIMVERDGCTYNQLQEFDQLCYENKVVFVHKEMPEIESAVYLSGTETKGDSYHYVQGLTNWKGHFSGERLMDAFDFVEFINNGINYKNVVRGSYFGNKKIY